MCGEEILMDPSTGDAGHITNVFRLITDTVRILIFGQLTMHESTCRQLPDATEL